jgi:nitrite reductase/ring-hydroxylating ferredoxin subunit
MTWHATAVDAAATATTPPIRVEIAGVPMLLVFAEDRWRAFEDRCSHAGCAFSTDGEVDGLAAICNCHGSEFDVRTGAVLVPPAKAPIRTFPARVVAGLVEIEL